MQISGGADGIKIDVEALAKRVDSLRYRDSLTLSSVSRLAVRLDSSVAWQRPVVTAALMADPFSDTTLAMIDAQRRKILELSARVAEESRQVDALRKSLVEHQANFRRFVDEQAQTNELMTKRLEATTLLMKKPE